MKSISNLAISVLSHCSYKVIDIPKKLQENNSNIYKSSDARVDKREVKRPDSSEFKSIDGSPQKFAHYIRNLPGAGKQIFDYIFSWRSKDIYLTNGAIAKNSGCCTKTVQRWTNRFMKEGILIKRQSDGNPYAPNDFYLNPRIKRGDISWHLTKESLTPKQKQVFFQIGIIVPSKQINSFNQSNVQHSRGISSLLTSSSIYTTQEQLGVNTHERVSTYVRGKNSAPGMVFDNTSSREENPFGITFEDFNRIEKLKAYRARLSRKATIRGGIMLSKAQKEFLVNKANAAGIKEYVYGPKIKPQIFTPLMDLIKREFELDEYAYLKLVCFDDKDLQEIKNIAMAKMRSSTWAIKSRGGLFIKTMNDYIEKTGIKPDWSFFKTLCEILEVSQPLPGAYKSKPIAKETKTAEPYKLDRSKVSEYSSLYVPPSVPKLTIEELIDKEQLILDDALRGLAARSWDKPWEIYAKIGLQNNIIASSAEIERLRSELRIP